VWALALTRRPLTEIYCGLRHSDQEVLSGPGGSLLMAQNYVDQAVIRQYLLGTLTPDLQQKLEERLLTETQFLEQLEIEEDELIDEYLADELSRDDREKFERHFLTTPERQQHLRFAVALRRYVVPSRTSEALVVGKQANRWGANQSAHFRAALVFGVVIILAVAFWLYRSRNSSAPTLALNLTNTVDNNRAQGVEAAKAHPTSSTQDLKLTLRLPEGAAGAVRYRITLDNLDSEHAEPRSFEPAGQDAQSVWLIIPAAQLARARYALKVVAILPDGNERRIPGAYYFDVD
jgi:hypothetical protein